MINPRQVRILVVDDEREIRDLLAARFAIFGLQTVTADSGDGAWQLIQGDPSIKIVVTDLLMANGTGHDLLNRCKQAHPEFPKVFAITGQTQFSAEHTLALGAEGFIHKPFDARALLNTVRNALLSLEERLRYPSHTTASGKLTRTDNSLKEALASGEFALGRGGAYFVVKETLPGPGHIVELEYSCGDFALQGTGLIRWQRNLPRNRTAVGVEFSYLDKDGLEAFCAHLNKAMPMAFIPSPQIANSMPSTAKLQPTG